MAEPTVSERVINVAKEPVRRYRRRAANAKLSPEQWLTVVYELLLHRAPDAAGSASYLPPLRAGTQTPAQLAEWVLASGEWWGGVVFTELLPSLHFSRSVFVRSLPKARRILDLGGTSLGSPQGALVLMGYPYSFEELIVIDLPQDERNELYQEQQSLEAFQSALGPVSYRYHSMSDLSAYADDSFDLVYSGQSIEHVPVDEADVVLREAARVLRPGGHLALDTPNATVCRVQQPELINPDHDYEYTHQEMVEKFHRAGFDILEAKGLNYAGRSLAHGEFSLSEVATDRGLYADIESCYLLSYICRTPAS